MGSQKEVCDRFNTEFITSSEIEKLGLAIESIGELPINGLRQKAENGTCGWYIWCGGEMSLEDDFFKPLHVSHIRNYLPQVEKYLALPPGYRFLIAGDYEDVWHDPSLINT